MKKSQKIIYWVATVWLALGMVSTGLVQLLKAKEGPGGVDAMTQLGYPLYFLTLLGIWKLLGAVAVCIPGIPRMKEWAYAGFFFIMTGALFSHLASGSPTGELFPAILLLVLTGLSWYFRPATRTLQTTTQT
jgi:uncharacterized membrane protein YphA (DoxX/SURF4 family)